MKEHYEKAIEAARKEIEEILQQRAALDVRLGQLKSTVETLSALLQEPPRIDPKGFWERFTDTPDGIGITDAIRQVLHETQTPLTPVRIKEILANVGFDLSGYANQAAVIHNTLARLEKQGEVTKIGDAYSLVRNVYAQRAKKVPFFGSY